MSSHWTDSHHGVTLGVLVVAFGFAAKKTEKELLGTSKSGTELNFKAPVTPVFEVQVSSFFTQVSRVQVRGSKSQSQQLG